MRYSSKEYGQYEIVENTPKDKCIIRFLNTGTITEVYRSQARNGQVKDPYLPKIYGKGYFGKGDYKRAEKERGTKCYDAWMGILRRCYDEGCRSYSAYGGKGVTVDPEWHNYQEFSEWFHKNYREGFQIDKDILSCGKGVYSKDTCEFVPPYINKLLHSPKARRGKEPLGVHYEKNSKSFVAHYSREGQDVLIGKYPDSIEAFLHYKLEKEGWVKEVAKEAYSKGEISERVLKALLCYDVKACPK